MHVNDPAEALDRPWAPFGEEHRSILVGEWVVRLSGLDGSVARELDRRWGPFVRLPPERDASEVLSVQLSDGGDRTWLTRTDQVEPYRVQARVIDGRPILASYHFLTGREPERSDRWRAIVTRTPNEPTGRVIENVVRMLLARLVVERGGVPFHGAGVLRDDGAHLLVGPSGAGKTTAVGLSRSGTPLGDDFALALPVRDAWCTAAVPFDNAEVISREPPRGWLPLQGVWRLFQSLDTRVESPGGVARDVSILACAAAPWSMPDRSEHLMENASRLGRAVRFGHLHFRRNEDFWDRIGPV